MLVMTLMAFIMMRVLKLLKEVSFHCTKMIGSGYRLVSSGILLRMSRFLILFNLLGDKEMDIIRVIQ